MTNYTMIQKLLNKLDFEYKELEELEKDPENFRSICILAGRIGVIKELLADLDNPVE